MDFTSLRNYLDTIPTFGAPGVDCVVMAGYDTVFRHHAGFADFEARKPMCGDELFNLYSTTKPITCAAALQLYEQGKFLLSDPLYEYMPEFRHMYVLHRSPYEREHIEPAASPITVRDLFTMSAGFDYDLNTPEVKKVIEETDGRAPTREIIRAYASKPLLYDPGTRWAYSLAHDVLGALIEVVSGERFGDYLRRHIFEPLGMNRTGFERTPEIESKMMAQYRYNSVTRQCDNIGVGNSYTAGSEYESGGAGLISCVEDYAKFVSMLANGGAGKNGERILGRCTIDLMRTNHLDPARIKDFTGRFGHYSGYGYGLGVRTHMNPAESGSLSPVGEFGWYGAAGAFMLADPVNKISMFYVQHALECFGGPHVHPRIKNAMYAGF